MRGCGQDRRRRARGPKQGVASNGKDTLQGLMKDHADPDAAVYTVDGTAYESLPFDHDTVQHSVQGYVKSHVHTNGIESLWSMMKCAHEGAFHELSPKYLQEFAGRHDVRDLDTIEQIQSLGGGMEDKRLAYKALIAKNGLASGARA